MGGSAFKLETHGFTTSRMSKDQYDVLSRYIVTLLKLYFRTVEVPPEAPGKRTFGDVDVMVCRPIDVHPHDAILQICSRALGKRCKGFIYALPTTNIAISLEDVIVQVDVHVVPSEEQWSVDYWMHSWGDMGMIISSMIKPWGLRLSASRGLWVNVHGLGMFVLSLDMERIASFLGLDWSKFNRGFKSTDELFEWMTEVSINGQQIGVKRNGKLEKAHQSRPMWAAYWERGEHGEYDPSEEEKRAVFRKALDYFNKRQDFEDTMAKLERECIAREKFNGHRVAEWTGLRGKRLGLLMKVLRGDERLMLKNVINLCDEDIKGIVLESWRGSQLQHDIIYG